MADLHGCREYRLFLLRCYGQELKAIGLAKHCVIYSRLQAAVEQEVQILGAPSHLEPGVCLLFFFLFFFSLEWDYQTELKFLCPFQIIWVDPSICLISLCKRIKDSRSKWFFFSLENLQSHLFELITSFFFLLDVLSWFVTLYLWDAGFLLFLNVIPEW